MAEYPPPLHQLLIRGEPRLSGRWPDYLKLGLTPEHVPDLIRMATDPELNQADPDSTEVWAPLHAWRALGQLRAEAAVEPLLSLIREDPYDEWMLEELPEVFGLIGPPAVPRLAAVLDNTSQDYIRRRTAGQSLAEVAERHPEARADCVAHLARPLERAGEYDRELNGFLIAYLLDLKAVESAPVMERAFAADAVDETIAGDWPYVQYQLGLTDEPPEGAYVPPEDLPVILPPPPAPNSRKAKDKAKAKRKMAAKSRKRNRKRR